MALWIHGQQWIRKERRRWWSTELIRDLAERDINGYHRFLWRNHMSYADTYEAETRFGESNMKGSRRIFFNALEEFVKRSTIRIKNVLEVGASLGYQLRFIETELFPDAVVIDGIDIDEYAVTSGQKYLDSLGSKVRLYCADMEELDESVGDRKYDLIICTGVLMYLDETTASKVVKKMMERSRGLIAFSGLAHPVVDNSQLTSSETREGDRSFIHNIDRMVKEAEGRVLWRRWDGSRLVDGNTIYFVFASQKSCNFEDGLIMEESV